MLPAILRKFGLTGAGVAPPQPVAPLAIRDRKTFDRLDRLLLAGWGNVSQDKIPEEILEAAEVGAAILERGPDRDIAFARPAGPPKKPPRVMTQERLERRRFLAKQRYDFRFPGKRKGD
jgi:hypothetical protein